MMQCFLVRLKNQTLGPTQGVVTILDLQIIKIEIYQLHCTPAVGASSVLKRPESNYPSILKRPKSILFLFSLKLNMT